MHHGTIYKKIITAIAVIALPVYIGIMIVQSNFPLLVLPTIIALSFIVLKNSNLAILFFILSPLYPNIFSNALNLPILNDLMFFFVMANISLLINSIFNTQINHVKIPKTLILLYIIMLFFIFVGAIRSPLTQNILLTKSLISNFGKNAIIISIMFYSVYFFKQKNKNNWVYIVSLLFYMILGDYYYDKIIFGVNYYSKMNSGFFGSGNNIGNILVVSIPFLFYLGYIKKTILIRWLPYLSIFAVFLSGSRGSIVAVIIMAIIYIFSRVDIINKNKAISLSIILILMVIFSGRLSSLINDTTSNVQIDRMTDESIGIHSSGRFAIWSRVFHYLNNSRVQFWVGGGTNDFLNYSDHNTQNHFLKTWVDYGLFGLIAELFFFAWIFYTCIKNIKTNNKSVQLLSKCLIFTMIGLSGVGLFSHFTLGSQELTAFWILIGWLIVEKEKINETETT